MISGDVIKLASFVVVSAALLFVSRKSLRTFRSHGFFRYFAWECMLAMFLVNMEFWFQIPFSPPQLVSWFLLIVSGVLAVHAAIYLRRHGQPDSSRQDDTLIGLEKTTQLVQQGAYQYIRHPLYASLLYLTWGIFLKHPGWTVGALAAGATGFLVATAKADEAECLRFFGPSYAEYARKTKMFIPFLF
ncbi:MAG: hypothetical protein A2X67_13805 [Ignavibacteria bacterium GWA2_55_11]|nr:MAG: hypothetical protein A2X67_13805 [Ignavibacteria bacterium GWA2_55_11]OGU64360.1 MAG: hypothetical protein A3C56_09720 [Ignavibacteria bacterium RIFCSPHIGHO2_02_FULL_56_12]OGU70803.1 MAG: hypothetical protein A3H45_03335 [Ignavibacteria bacterium RIFCSPLOWO2_02_FULL_55_14]OGU75664.1 MAG: hypothetical protein A3G43_13885 [Ignavibacteria bacterium RIFCSPLOWO2_12_FULL_56_21]